MGIVDEQTSKKAETLGIEVIDVRIKKIELPSEVSSSVYNRMRTGRELVARDLRSKGSEASERIRADADRQSAVILAEAYRDAEITRGKGDAEATVHDSIKWALGLTAVATIILGFFPGGFYEITRQAALIGGQLLAGG